MRCLTQSAFTLLFLATACTGSTTSTNGVCEGAKCDTPGNAADTACAKTCSDASNRLEGENENDCRSRCRDEAAVLHCTARKADAVDSAQKTFTKDAIRWACSDVAGVNTVGRDDRGQEYCEYFAAIQLPPKAEGAALPDPVTPGRNQDGGRPPMPTTLDLSEDQIFALEDNPTAEVGSCVFSSWHQDIGERLPVCGDSDVTCPKLSLAENAILPPWTTSNSLGIPLTESNMKMKVTINSNNAAADLFEKCLVEPPVGDATDPADPLHDDFIRGCWKSYELFKTEWRRSDPSVCAVGVRLNECGCGVDTDGDGVADVTDAKAISRAVVPHQPDADGNLQLRGFPLGTWSGGSALPVGCSYVDIGEGTQTLVSCKITAGDVLANQNDPKEFCRAKYGDDVVVHVPVPAAALVCNPPEGMYNTCSDMPWVIDPSAPGHGGKIGDGGDGGGDNGGDTDPVDNGNDCEIDPADAESSNGTYDATTGTGECECVKDTCLEDTFCCTTDWDDICVGLAEKTASCATHF